MLQCVLWPSLIRCQNSPESPLFSQTVVLSEKDQFHLGVKLFWEKDKRVSAWKAFQTFLANYPNSPLAADAQFLLAESLFQESLKELKTGNPPDESVWIKENTGKIKNLSKGFLDRIDRIKYLGADFPDEKLRKKNGEEIERATFSEAIEQYRKVLHKKYKKSGLADTALYRMAECYYNRTDYATALLLFRRLKKEFPHSYLSGEALFSAAQCYIPSGDLSSAESEIRKLLSGSPWYQDDPRVHFLLGTIQFQSGKYTEAIESLNKVNNAEGLYYAAQAQIQIGRPLEAASKFKKVADEYKGHRFAERAAYFVAESIFLSKNYLGATQEYGNFLSLYPRSALKEAALYKIAACHFLREDYTAARESFYSLLKEFPSGEFASLSMYFIAESYRLTQQLKEASFSYGQLISALPNAPVTTLSRYKLGAVTYSQGNYTGSLNAFQRFVEWDPFHPWIPYAYLFMADAYNRTGRAEDAAIAYQQAFDRSPKTDAGEAAMSLLNRTRYLQKNYSQLTSGYTYILKSLLPTESKWRAISLLYLADSYYIQKQYSEAIAVFQNILSLYPTQPASLYAYDGLYWSYFQLGDYARAQTTREKMRSVKLPEGIAFPKMTSGSFEVANALFNQKKYLDAIPNYEQFVRESPDSSDVTEAMYRIGLCYYRLEYYSQAIAAWEDMEKRFPKDERTEEAVFQIADTYFRAQKQDKAIETFRKILDQYPFSARRLETMLRIGQSYYNAGQYDKSVPELENFLKRYPADPKSNETLDLLESSVDRLESRGGVTDLERQKWTDVFRRLAGDLPKGDLAAECLFRLARRLFNLKDYESAVKEFEKLSFSYPSNPHTAESQFYAGESSYLLKRYPDGILAFKRFIENFPDSEFVPAALFHLGTAYYNVQNLEGAIGAYEDLSLRHGNSEFASAGLFNLALAQKKLLRLVPAADSYYKFALTYPNDANANFALLEVARIKQSLQQHAEAIAILKDLETKLLPADEQKLEVIYLIAESYLGLERTSEAIETLKKLTGSSTRNPLWKLEAFRKLGEIYEKGERWKDAAQTYEEGSRVGGSPQISASFRARAKYLRENYPASGNANEPKSTGGSSGRD
ncbi:MAG: tetratricopeptide repeat protein [Elusimicrobia bacterium]|nr:tetratricopeptide repeat protein [Elusimicrobiota bacterium]